MDLRALGVLLHSICHQIAQRHSSHILPAPPCTSQHHPLQRLRTQFIHPSRIINPDTTYVQLFIYCIYRIPHYLVCKLYDTHLFIHKTQEHCTLNTSCAEGRLYIILGIFEISSILVFNDPYKLLLSLLYCWFILNVSQGILIKLHFDLELFIKRIF